MSVEWGPWIEHDGNGCPPSLIGRYIEAAFEVSHDDCEGGKAGDFNSQETMVSASVASNPMWNHANFGRLFSYLSGPYAGHPFYAAKLLRYRVRKPRGMAQVLAALTDLPINKSKEVEEA